MTSIQINDIRQFMKNILTGTIFDEFYVFKLKVKSFCDFTIDGSVNDEFYTLEEKEQFERRKYIKWEEIKYFVHQIMKGKKTPVSFHIILMLSDDNISKLTAKYSLGIHADDINGLFLNINYENKLLNLVTGTSRKNFTLDKTLDDIWDEQIKQFLKQNEIT